jgi:hypothetical protein
MSWAGRLDPFLSCCLRVVCEELLTKWGALRVPLPYTLIGSRVSWHICTQIGQTLANCAALWSCTECARMIHWQSASRCTKHLSGTRKYYDSGTVISCFTLEECELECLCTNCIELLLFVHSSGGISEEIPVWNGDWSHQIQTQQWASQEAHTCTCLQQWLLTSSSDVPSLFWCFNTPVTPPSYWFFFLVF